MQVVCWKNSKTVKWSLLISRNRGSTIFINVNPWRGGSKGAKRESITAKTHLTVERPNHEIQAKDKRINWH